MNILIVNPSKIPALLYGGTERVIWYLGKELNKMGHKVSYLVAADSECDFADVIFIDTQKSLNSQIPEDIDIVHFNFPVDEEIDKPYVTTIHGNSSEGQEFHENTIFVSSNHAKRHNSKSFVYNGLDWSDYGKPNFTNERKYFHFLANAAWKVKNVKGAISACKLSGEKLAVLGGNRLNLKMGFRFTTSTKAKFYGMVGGQEKNALLSQSKGLIFPVLWDEPFGLALTESMFLGCPIFGTPYGALPELVGPEEGFLSESITELSIAMEDVGIFNKKYISEYARERFNSKVMAIEYLNKYEIVLAGKNLNSSKPRYVKDLHKQNYTFA